MNISTQFDEDSAISENFEVSFDIKSELFEANSIAYGPSIDHQKLDMADLNQEFMDNCWKEDQKDIQTNYQIPSSCLSHKNSKSTEYHSNTNFEYPNLTESCSILKDHQNYSNYNSNNNDEPKCTILEEQYSDNESFNCSNSNIYNQDWKNIWEYNENSSKYQSFYKTGQESYILEEKNYDQFFF